MNGGDKPRSFSETDIGEPVSLVQKLQASVGL